MKFLVLLAAVGLAAAETKVASVGGNVSPYAPLHTHTQTVHTYHAHMLLFQKGMGGFPSRATSPAPYPRTNYLCDEGGGPDISI